MNRLVGRKGLARISSTPGRTRAVNYFLINRRFYFVDLPGYGYARAGRDEQRRWAQLVERYFQRAASGTQVVLLVDAKVGATELDCQAFEYLSDLGVDLIVAATKFDKVPRGDRKQRLAEIRATLALGEAIRLIAVSARSGEGVQTLWQEIVRRLRSNATSDPPRDRENHG